MSNGSPSAYLLWALLAVANVQFFVFMLIHIWNYDKFKCLRWDSGRQPGAFKRVMTYSYFATVPLLMVFSVAMAALKYQEGALLRSSWKDPSSTICPLAKISHPVDGTPLLRSERCLGTGAVSDVLVDANRSSSRSVTHLEELTFWVFLLHQGPKKREWFSSWEFRAWYIGSMIAIIGMPLTTLMKRHHIETTEAWIFTAGASAGTFTTVCFLYVLWNFPRFIRSVKAEGAVPDVVVRLSTFYHLNCIRVVFRFLFTVPLLTLALDALVDQKRFLVVSSPFWSDIFLMTGGIGCFISSAITMLIFFPRSITSEAGYKARLPSQNSKRAAVATPLPDYEHHETPISSPKSIHSFSRPPPQPLGYEDSPSPPAGDREAQLLHHQHRPSSGVARSEETVTVWDGASRKPTASTSTSVRYPAANTPVMVDGVPIYVDDASAPQYGRVHHYAMSFTSPIDLPEETNDR
ncbi:hypothetical protein MIND_01382300 [Mycena indigotica]|uniref:Transmembrane protein n=1 Tax=Mycena indigotica TaxID=2126181 RepID=A0A8H6RZF7_9AGAR|nr:uncharacterized protein MIND_01382300 [Mycena indigotica]KAF7289211.1 hypothetical protein MIND_01382300 [Mycena indigotica]